MSEINRTSSGQLPPNIFIPPLKFRDSDDQEQPVNRVPQKEPLSLLKEALQKNDSEFLKEKSLYRYTISRKMSKEKLNKTHAYCMP